MPIYRVETVQGTKDAIPISGSVPTGNPVGSLLYTYKKIQPRNYLYCDGSTFNAGQYPALYLYLGSNVLPDYRECSMVGAEENTTDQIETHDVYAQGEFKDDQIQNITGDISSSSTDYSVGASTNANTVSNGALNAENFDSKAFSGSSGSATYFSKIAFDASRSARAGTVTRGKRKAVYVYIKAVDGVDITDEDTFLVTVKNYVDNKLVTAESYSETETLTGGTWIDGKPIYRKVVDCGALPNNTSKTVAHNISNLETVVKLYAIASKGDDWMPIPEYYSGEAIGLSLSTTDVYLRPYSNRTSYTTTYAIIEYTKSTD